MAITADAVAIPSFTAPYAGDDDTIVRAYLAETALDAGADEAIDARATRLIAAIRERSGGIGGLEDFLRAFSLSTREGLALMVLAEALLRVPDAATQDRLIEDKLAAAGDGEERGGRPEKFLVQASIWALGLTSRILRPGDTPEGVLGALVKRLGQPAVRAATRQAMRVLGHHFVLGQTIGGALQRARPLEEEGFSYSFDMLGEGARTAADAEQYFLRYVEAIEAIGNSPDDGEARRGLSVKLSALHPRYEAVKRDRVMRELVPRLLDLVSAAQERDLMLTVDAEEADRLELSLEVFAAVATDSSRRGTDGFGLAVQAYQKRATAVIDWVGELASATGARLAVRLVKGAYWDSEIKRGQERSLADYPVFSRKAATDLSYLACAHRLLASPKLFPQFATHNALTVATILEMAGDGRDFEFQRLHGMGEGLYAALADEESDVRCRIYAPVGGHRELLAYLVRRLLENGANTSFVANVGDPEVPVAHLLERPAAALRNGARHPRIPLPAELYAPVRKNSRGMEFGSRADLKALTDGVLRRGIASVSVLPDKSTKIMQASGRGPLGPTRTRLVYSPIDEAIIGASRDTALASVDTMMSEAAKAFRPWSQRSAEERAGVLDRLSDLIEGDRDRLVSLLAREGGKTLNDGIGEVREAVDFCRYYAAEARRLFAGQPMPGPTGESNTYAHRGRGVFVCISPWNFPLSIFLGQVAAALAAGNAVIAKPAEQTPLIALRAFELLHAAGVPPEVAQLALGDGSVGAALVAHPSVAGVAFTGSTEVGRLINRALAATDGPIVPLIAETGGINAMIVDGTALPEQVTDDVVTSAFRSAGQRCSALRLLCLQEDVADAMLDMIAGAAAELRIGDPRDPSTDVGPVIDADAKAALEAHRQAVEQASWATVRFAGQAPGGPGQAAGGGTYFAPMVVEIDRPERLKREVFGPILHVVRWQANRLESLLDSIAETGYGLTLGVHSRIDDTVARVVRRLGVGNVYVNRSMIGAVVGTQPFGGSGLSGTGPKAGGPEYLSRFAVEQVVSINTAAAGGNASLIAMGEG